MQSTVDRVGFLYVDVQERQFLPNTCAMEDHDTRDTEDHENESEDELATTVQVDSADVNEVITTVEV